MPALVLGVIVLILLLFAAYSFSKADPKNVVRVLQYIGGGAALLFAVFLLVRGAIVPAVSRRFCTGVDRAPQHSANLIADTASAAASLLVRPAH